MATFDQRGQLVHGGQYNAGHDINFNEAKSPDEFLRKLEDLKVQLEKAINDKAITGDNAIDAKYHVDKALNQAKEATPDKKKLTDHLTSAKEIVSGISGLSKAVGGAIAVIKSLF